MCFCEIYSVSLLLLLFLPRPLISLTLSAYSVHTSVLGAGSASVVKQWSLDGNVCIPAGMTDTESNYEAM